MIDIINEIDERCKLISSLIGSCCVWKKSAYCLTENCLKYSFMHQHPFCDKVKKQCGLLACQRNDTDSIIKHLKINNYQPFVHKCHANACEMVIPVQSQGRILGCVLCGPFSTVSCSSPLLTPWKDSFIATLPKLVDLILKEHLERFYNKYPTNKLIDPRIEKTLNYIAGNISKKIVLEDVANLVHLSPSRYSHLFKSACGTDFSSYLLNLRLSIAQEMLRQTNMPISEIALCTGFSSQQHFSTLFRKFINVSPKKYRKG